MNDRICFRDAIVHFYLKDYKTQMLKIVDVI